MLTYKHVKMDKINSRNLHSPIWFFLVFDCSMLEFPDAYFVEGVVFNCCVFLLLYIRFVCAFDCSLVEFVVFVFHLFDLRYFVFHFMSFILYVSFIYILWLATIKTHLDNDSFNNHTLTSHSVL